MDFNITVESLVSLEIKTGIIEMMIKELKIERYRGLKDVLLQDIGQINILIGANNSGKTSVLEAVQLLKSKDIIANLFSVSVKREPGSYARLIGSYSKYDALNRSLPIGQEERKIGISALLDDRSVDISVKGHETKCDIGLLEISSREERLKGFPDNGNVNAISGEYSFSIDKKSLSCNEFTIPEMGVFRSDAGKVGGIGKVDDEFFKARYICPGDIYNGSYIKSFIKGLPVDEKNDLIALLRLFDRKIKNIETSINGESRQILVEDEDGVIKPLSVYGDGMKRVFSIASTLVEMKNGALLVDEFDVGIHKSAINGFVEFLCDSARKNQTQVFLTTHSGDAIDALIEIGRKDVRFNVFFLDTLDDKVYPRRYDWEELYNLKNEQGYVIL